MTRLPFGYSPLPERAPVRWPGGARVAVYMMVAVEYFEPGKPALSIHPGTAAYPVDPLNYGWRDYGPRAGIWRIMDLFDRYEVPVSAALNSDVCEHHPQIIEAGNARDWVWVAHGKNNNTMQGPMTEDEEAPYLEAVVGTITDATGRTPRGWMGPSLTETVNTPRLAGELGISYVVDWGNDDQCFRLISERSMVSIPYPSELHDIPMLLMRNMPGHEFAASLIEHFTVLAEEAEARDTGYVFGIGVHPFLIGQPWRIRYLEKVVQSLRHHEAAWWLTTDELAGWWLENAAADRQG